MSKIMDQKKGMTKTDNTDNDADKMGGIGMLSTVINNESD